jgi:GTP-binding protein
MAKARIAQTSSAPGKTRLLNFYSSPHYRLVDMPGYGFSTRSGHEQQAWRTMIESYLVQRKNLIGLLIVMDIRRDWSDDEQDLVQWIQRMVRRELPAALILTKADKLSRSAATDRMRKIAQNAPVEAVILTSAAKKIGFENLEDFIFKTWIQDRSEAKV